MMPSTPQLTLPQLRRRLLAWYDNNKRDLPWRGEHDPYRIWVSEIMLQQTRVAAVIEYYHRFLKKFPTVKKLAQAKESDVLAQWSGLGYYRRARMMHQAAQIIVKEHGSKFPRTSEALRTLPGIGRYTAAAIASIAFNEPVAVLDGNVERVLIRVHGKKIRLNKLWDIAQQWLAPSRPGDFNQAMMELGATVCLPKSPLCQGCPLFQWCKTKGEHSGGKREKRKQVEISLAFFERNGKLQLIQRAHSHSLMAGMWELPRARGKSKPILLVKHSITDTDYLVTVHRRSQIAQNGHWIKTSELNQLPLTGLTRKVLTKLEILKNRK
jgi:A/G-specific adenine glycosylase